MLTSSPAPELAIPTFLKGSGEMLERVRVHPWEETPLGPPSDWPKSLQVAMGICLHSSFPTAIYWGRELRLLYNDAWAPIPGERHPWALGRPAKEVWSDIWSVIAPQFETVLTTGEGLALFNQMLPMERQGRSRETYWNYSFTPIRGESGEVVGVFNQGHEVTEQVMASRHQHFMLKLSDCLRDLNNAPQIIELAQRLLGEELGADRVGYGNVDESERFFTTETNWTSGHIPSRAGTHDLAAFGTEVHEKLKSGEALVMEDVTSDSQTDNPAILEAFKAIDTRAALTSSLIKNGKMVAALYVHSREPREWTTADQLIVADVAERTWDALNRAQAEILANASEARLRNVLNRMNEGFSLLGHDFTILDVNEEAMRLETRPRSAIVGQSHWEVYPGTKGSVLGRLYEKAMYERVPVTLEHEYTWEDGRSAWLDMRAYPIDDGLAVFYRDITERKRVQERVEESEAQLRAVYNAVPVGIVIAEAPSGRITGGNAEVERVFGHSVLPSPDVASYREWIGFHADGRRVASEEYPLSRALGGEERPELEIHYQRGDGRKAWLRLIGSPIRDPEGEILGAVVAALDVDEKRQAEEALTKLNEELECEVQRRTAERDRMWRLSTDLMLVATFDGRIEAVNPAWTRLLGWQSNQLIGSSFMSLLHPDDVEATVGEMSSLEEGVTTFSFTNRYRKWDGDYCYIAWTAVPGDNLIHAVGRDITAERRAAVELEHTQEALRQAQKLEAMGQLTGGVAHDFNNLLSPIIGGLDLLQRRGIGDERAKRMIDGALASAERAKTLVQRLLAFARRQPLQPTAVDVHQTITDLSHLLASTLGPRIHLGVEIAKDLPLAHADGNQLEMALLNLAVNARDAMPDGGTLSILADRQIAGEGGELAAGQFVRITVRDDGQGMDEETLARCIEPFFSTKGVGQGTGLGLSMVHGLAAQLSGALRIQSAPGEGTAIELWLPVSDEIAAIHEDAEQHAVSQGAGTALVVDDEELVRLSTAEMLEGLGYETIEASSAEVALKVMDERSIDLLVTDHLMPGMTGTDLAKAVRKRFPSMKIVIVSGYADVQGLDSAFTRLTKPFRQAELAAAVSD